MQSITKKITIGIIGGAGYTAGELLRILLNHPNAEIVFVLSNSQSGKPVHEIHEDLFGSTEIEFCSEINPNVDVVFLCQGHGKAKAALDQFTFSSKTKIIDLGNDFRLKKDRKHGDKQFVYGLPELNKDTIKSSNYIANPGCFATAIQLALLPLANAVLIKSDVHVNAITGSTGAGQNSSATGHFSWRNNNVSTYKVFDHQHLGEINESLLQLQNSLSAQVNFVPIRGNFTRGIFATAYTEYEGTLEEAYELYNLFYENAAFTWVSKQDIHLKQVVNTNKCLIHLKKHEDKLFITSIIDNLIKGASGQAIQNMNLMFGLVETTGLQLKAGAF